MAAGKDTDPSPGEARLKQYWGPGDGGIRIGWGRPGDFQRCLNEVGRYIHSDRELKGFCANVHHDVLGYWPNEGPHAGKHGHQ